MRRLHLALAAALSLSTFACASAPAREPVTVTSAASEPEPFSAPLLAKDVDDPQATPRIAETKTIGGDGESYDLGRPRKGAATPAAPVRTTQATSMPRYYYRSGGRTGVARGAATGTSSTSTQAGAAAGSGPSVAGDWPSSPSYGPRTMGGK
jgi:hypothetical protein